MTKTFYDIEIISYSENDDKILVWNDTKYRIKKLKKLNAL